MAGTAPTIASAPPPQESTHIWDVVWEELKFAWRIVYCAAYVCWWRFKHYIFIDENLNKRAKIAAGVSGAAFFADIVLFFFHREMAKWIGPAALIVLVPTGGLLLLHRIVEMVAQKKKDSCLERIEPLANSMGVIGRASPTDKKKAVDSFVEELLKSVHDTFSERKLASLNVMFSGTDGKLRVVFLWPVGTQYDPSLSFSPGQGGAGLCYIEKKVIYIPATRYAHGISLGIPDIKAVNQKIMYGLLRRVYVDISPGYEVFNSIVCVPVEISSGKLGVLNLDCKAQDSFNIHDFRALKVFATMLGAGISMGL